MTTERRRRWRGGRVALVVGLVVFVVLLLSLRGLARIYTDYLWYDSVGRTDVWTGVVGIRIGLALTFTAAFAVLLWVNLLVADRLAPEVRPLGPEEDLLIHYHRFVAPRVRSIRITVAVLLGLIVGLPASAHWNEWILFRNGVDFGIDDPLHGRDIGFYVFRLPFLSYALDWLFGAVVFVLVLTVIAHYLNGGIRVQTVEERATPLVKAHVSVLLGTLAVLKGVDYWFQRYELTGSSNGYVNGAGYTDVEARLPAMNLLALISLFAAALLVWNIRRRGWALPAVAVGLWAFVAVLIGAIYPAFVQWRTVSPAESDRERPFIERNIEATRAAYGLDAVVEEAFDYDEDITADELREHAEALRGIRLLDPVIVSESFDRLQRGRNFYRFVNRAGVDSLDVDRYEIDGELTSVVLGVRGLDVGEVTGWENQHVGFTHGYGLALATAQAVTASGAPSFSVGSLPVESSRFVEPITQPQVYVGENLTGYAIVGAERDEVDFPSEDQQTQLTRYEGADGVELDSFIDRAAIALRFGQFEPLLSDLITSRSRVIFNRDVDDRLREIAPFLTWDDPYPVVHEGRIVFIADGYTTTDRYPYSQAAPVSARTGTGIAPHNYIRNPVKAVVDSYDGTVTLYRMDVVDPIADAYGRAFPDLFVDVSELPAALGDHLRYGDALFRVQSSMWSRYHVDDPSRFHSGDSEWAVALDPGRTGESQAASTTGALPAATASSRAPRMDPLYGLFELPGSSDVEFATLRAFVAAASSGQSSSLDEMTGLIVGRSDADRYGQLVVYRMDAGDANIPSPTLADQQIRNEQDVSRLQTELGQRGSRVLFGEMQVVPINNSILFVRPMYVRAEGENAVPEVEYVIVALGAEVVLADDLESALEQLVGEPLDDIFASDADEGIDPVDPADPADPGETPPEDESVEELLARIIGLQADADQVLEDEGVEGLTRYVELQGEIRELVERAYELTGGTIVPPLAPPTTGPNGEDGPAEA